MTIAGFTEPAPNCQLLGVKPNDYAQPSAFDNSVYVSTLRADRICQQPGEGATAKNWLFLT